jgi:hypothetical protein
VGVLQEIRLDRLEEILLSDPDELNRDQAAAALGSLNRGRKDSGLVTFACPGGTTNRETSTCAFQSLLDVAVERLSPQSSA